MILDLMRDFDGSTLTIRELTGKKVILEVERDRLVLKLHELDSVVYTFKVEVFNNGGKFISNRRNPENGYNSVEGGLIYEYGGKAIFKNGRRHRIVAWNFIDGSTVDDT